MYDKQIKKTTQQPKYERLENQLLGGVAEYRQKSLREIAQAISGTKSSVHRSENPRKKRNQHPESYLWMKPFLAIFLRLCPH